MYFFAEKMESEELFVKFNKHIGNALVADKNNHESEKLRELVKAHDKLGSLIQKHAKDYVVLTYEDSSGDERCIYSEEEDLKTFYITKQDD